MTLSVLTNIILITCSVLHHWPRPAVTHQCEESITGISLRGHAYQTITSRSIFDCYYACVTNVICQSFNYYANRRECELNNRTRRSRDQRVVIDATSLYYDNPYRVFPGSMSEVPALSCREIRDSDSHVVSDRYWIVQHMAPRQVYCNMTTTEIVECPGTPCFNNGTCEYQGGDDFVCICQIGYTGARCEIAPECQSYSNLTEASRNIKIPTGSAPAVCDDNLVRGWYRITGGAGTRLPENKVDANKCGTSQAGWLNGSHPDIADGLVTAQVCFTWAGDGCYTSVNVRVRNCGLFYIYELIATATCSRYCGE